MAKYRKKPVMIEAYQFLKGYFEDDKIPFEFRASVCRKHCPGMISPARPHIQTLEGNHYVVLFDWIIKGVQGEFYPCKPDIFEATYEKV